MHHLDRLADALRDLDLGRLEVWADALCTILHSGGGRLLVAGNGGSAAQGQHLTAELVGRFRVDRPPLSAIALHAESSSVTAIGNDYGFDEIFARQVRAHGRRGDVLLLISTSGTSPNLLRAADTAAAVGLHTWALTGPAPNILSGRCESAVCIDAPSAATVQECHLVAVHVLCGLVEQRLGPAAAAVVAPVDSVARIVDEPEVSEHAERRLVVVGDTCLDRDVTGKPRRQVADMADHVLDDATVTECPGAAGLAATMAAAAPGWQVSLITALGADAPGEAARAALVGAGVEIIDLAGRGQSATKTRVIAAGRPVARFDQPQVVEFGPVTTRAVLAVESATAVLVCDYGMGLTDQPPVRALLDRRPAGSPLVWDPHPRGGPPIPGTTLAVPNAVEAGAAVGDHPHGALGIDVAHGRRLLEQWPVQAVALTRGRDGAIMLTDAEAPALVVSPGHPGTDAGDSRGAGDRFAVAVTLALGQGSVLSAAVQHAVAVAGEYVRRGAAPGPHRPARHGRVVATAGCFDVLHAGHLALLRGARALGDHLVVCLNSDDSVARIKGPARPVVPAADRGAVLASLECVDEVIVFDDDTPHRVLDRVRPDVYVKGGDYAYGDLPERTLVESWGGDVVLVPYLAGRSTTGILRDAAEREARSRS